MPSAGDLPTAATLSVPSWMWGADSVQFFAAAGLHSRAVDGSPDRGQLQTHRYLLDVLACPDVVHQHLYRGGTA